MTRVLRLTLPAPDVVEAILDGRQPPEKKLGDLLENFRGSEGPAVRTLVDGREQRLAERQRGSQPAAARPRIDNAMVKALARALPWRLLLDEGACGTMEEPARRERVNRG